MNAIRMFQTAVTTLVIIILAGCSDSDNLTSSGATGNLPKTSSKKDVSTVEENIPAPVPVPVIPTHRVSIRIKPYRTYVFDASNTGFKKITSVDIAELSQNESDINVRSCRDFAIYGDSKNDTFINCHSNGFQYSKIVIENLTSKFLELDVSLTGVREKKSILDSD